MPPWLIVALRLTGLGWYVALCIVIGILGGLWLGKLSGQVALFVLIGTVLGSVIAFYGVYRMVLRAVYGSNPPGSSPPRRDPRDTDGGY
jgi:cytochrome b561